MPQAKELPVKEQISRLKQLQERAKKELNMLISCIKRDGKCDATRKKVYGTLAALAIAIPIIITVKNSGITEWYKKNAEDAQAMHKSHDEQLRVARNKVQQRQRRINQRASKAAAARQRKQVKDRLDKAIILINNTWPSAKVSNATVSTRDVEEKVSGKISKQYIVREGTFLKEMEITQDFLDKLAKYGFDGIIPNVTVKEE